MFDKLKNDTGVSPVIGVILMVAVTVALVALVTVTVFDLGGDVSDSPDATVQLEQDGNTVSATVLRNENVDDFTLQASDGSTTNLGGDAGANAELTSGATQTSTETFQTADSDVGDGSDPLATNELITLNNDLDSLSSVAFNTNDDGTFDDTGRESDFDTSGGNADQIEYTGTDFSAAGNTNPDIQVEYDYSSSTFDSVQVIANMPDGGSEVLTTTDVDN